MLTSALDLTVVLWEAKHKDGTVLKRGPQTYQKIDRANLETVSITYKGTKLFDKFVKDTTFVYRLRNAKPMELGHDGTDWYGKPLQTQRLGVVIAFLKKHKLRDNNKVVNIFEYNDKSGKMDMVQRYEYDPIQSQIYTITPNGKIQINSEFTKSPPSDKIKLRPEELENLNSA